MEQVEEEVSLEGTFFADLPESSEAGGNETNLNEETAAEVSVDQRTRAVQYWQRKTEQMAPTIEAVSDRLCARCALTCHICTQMLLLDHKRSKKEKEKLKFHEKERAEVRKSVGSAYVSLPSFRLCNHLSHTA